MSVQILHPNLITVVPGSISIQNFIPGKLYKDNITIYNTCNVPIVINLRSSDRNKLFVGENLIRLGVNQAKKIPLIIQDKIKYNYNKLPTQKLLYIHLSGELIRCAACRFRTKAPESARYDAPRMVFLR